MAARFGKQIKIIQMIQSFQTDLNFGQILHNLVDEVRRHEKNLTVQKHLCDFFVSVKSKLNDQSLDRMLQNFQELHTENTENDTLALKTDKQNPDPNPLLNLPQCMIIRIGSYLNLKSNLNLSQCNRMLLSTVNSKDYIDQSRDNKSLMLTDKQIGLIFKHGCQLPFFDHKNCYELSFQLNNPHGYTDCDCNDTYSCTLMKLNNLADTWKTKPNYDLVWLKTVLANTKNLLISNSWECVFKHLPMEWIFGDHKSDPLRIVGSCDEKDDYELSNRLARDFASQYSRYMSTLSPENRPKTRKLERIWFAAHKIDEYDYLRNFGTNFTGVVIDLPRVGRGRFRTLQEFFDVHHCNLNWFEVCCDNASQAQQPITSQFFSDPEITSDLIKTERQLSFQAMLKKHGCESAVLPSIEVVEFNFDDDVFMLESLLSNGKLMMLFNFYHSAEKLILQVEHGTDFETIRMISAKCMKNFTNLRYVNIIVCIKGSEKSTESPDIASFHHQYLADILIDCVVSKSNIEELELQWGYDGVGKVCESAQIVISDKKNLLYHRRDRLRSTINQSIVKMLSKTQANWKGKSRIADKKKNVVEKFVFRCGYLL